MSPGLAYWRDRWHVYREDQGQPASAVWDVVEVAGDIAYALARPVDDANEALRRAMGERKAQP